jgi:U32 family peptidase
MELLAPAGGRDSLLAAIHNGADAVYLGYTAFGARAGAGNFDEDSLTEAVKLCHLYHVRVYVTVNTLVKETEIPDLYRALSTINRVGADAVILQDFGVAGIVRDCFPNLHRHASTQMAIHNRQGAAFLLKEGFKRVVLARECSLQEIKRVTGTGLATEVFVHGAMCVCVSGQCLFSSMAGGRSGNRGRCAQPCRMLYDFGGRRGYWLSPRDMMLRDKLPDLFAAGVHALKIEGRLKRPEYVAVVTRAYRKALDALEEGRFTPADESEKESLRQVFHRGGFMTGYIGGSQDAGVIDQSRPGHGGVMIGHVTGLRPGFAQVKLVKDLNDGDGLQFRGRTEEEVTYSGPGQKAGDTALVRLRVGVEPQVGDDVARLVDAAQLMQAMLAKAPRILVDAVLSAIPREASKLNVTDGETAAEVTGEAVAVAQSKPLTEENARRAIEKTGDTPFALHNFRLIGQDGFLPVSALNALRRDALDDLYEKRSANFSKRDFTSYPLAEVAFPSQKQNAPGLLVQSADASLGQKLLDLGADVFLYAPEIYTESALDEAAGILPKGTWLVLPIQAQADTLVFLKDWANGRKELLSGVVLGSIGQVGAGFTLPMAAGESVPVMNGRTAAELDRLGFRWQTVSPELNEKEISQLPLSNLPFVLPMFGRTRLMTLNHCPARTALGLHSGHESCRLCEQDSIDSLRGKRFSDGLDHEFPLLRTRLPEGCIIHLYNTLPLNLTAQADKLRGVGWLVTFTTETVAEQLDIAASFVALRRGQPCETALPAGTAGHYKRGVE